MRVFILVLSLLVFGNVAFPCPELGDGSSAEPQILDFTAGLKLLSHGSEINKRVKNCFYSFQVTLEESNFLMMFGALDKFSHKNKLDPIYRKRLKFEVEKARKQYRRRLRLDLPIEVAYGRFRRARNELRQFDEHVSFLARGDYAFEKVSVEMLESYVSSTQGQISSETLSILLQEVYPVAALDIIFSIFELEKVNGTLTLSRTEDLITEMYDILKQPGMTDGVRTKWRRKEMVSWYIAESSGVVDFETLKTLTKGLDDSSRDDLVFQIFELHLENGSLNREILSSLEKQLSTDPKGEPTYSNVKVARKMGTAWLDSLN